LLKTFCHRRKKYQTATPAATHNKKINSPASASIKPFEVSGVIVELTGRGAELVGVSAAKLVEELVV